MADVDSQSSALNPRARSWTGILVSVVLLAAPGVGVRADPGTIPRLPWFFDGAVLASARLGNTLYVGGTFTAVAPSASAMPPTYALSEATGAVVGPVFPQTDREVVSIEPDGAGGYFVGGTFTVVGTLSQSYLAHVLASGAVDPLFRPVLTGPVRAMARVGNALYVLGGFDGASFPPRLVAAVSTLDGSRLSWNPAVPYLQTIAGLLVAENQVVIWGTEQLSMITSGIVVAYDAGTAAQAWVTRVSGGVRQYNAGVATVLPAGDHLIVASSDGLRRLSLATGAVDPGWIPGATPSVLALAGSTLYLGGAFASVAGQPRQNLAAIDLVSAALLPWNPRAPVPVTGLATTSSGGIYVTGDFAAFAGQARVRLARLDASGALSPWMPAVPPGTVAAMREGEGGTLVIASSLTGAGRVARSGLAAFDLDTGALLPWDPGVGAIRFLAAGGDRVWAGISGATFAFDAATGVGVDFVGYSTPFFADDRWLYRASWSPETGALAIERAELVTGLVDRMWRPSTFVPDSVARQGDALYFASRMHGLARIDRRTARVRWTNPAAAARFVAVSGDTVFTYNHAFVEGLQSFDVHSGAPIRTRIWNPPNVEGLALADGQLVVAEWPVPTLVSLDGQEQDWDLALSRTLGGFGGHVSVAGDVLVLGGQFGRRLPDAQQGLVVVSLDGQRPIADLRARPSGPTTAFSWTPPTSVPAGGYVVEAGTAPGTTQVTIPVGGASSFAAEIPPGDFFVRVRTVGAGGDEQVSNEIRVRGGCVRAPSAPAGLAAQPGTASVTLTWAAPDDLVTRYIVEAGSAPGRVDLASIDRPGDQTTLSAQAPPGTYHVRVRAENACGNSAPSASVYFTVGAAGSPPGAPSGLRFDYVGLVQLISWTPPAGEVTGYLLEAGSDVGLADLLVTNAGPYPQFAIPPFTTPPGTYVVRARAYNAAGVGPPSEDFVLRLPASP